MTAGGVLGSCWCWRILQAHLRCAKLERAGGSVDHKLRTKNARVPVSNLLFHSLCRSTTHLKPLPSARMTRKQTGISPPPEEGFTWHLTAAASGDNSFLPTPLETSCTPARGEHLRLIEIPCQLSIPSSLTNPQELQLPRGEKLPREGIKILQWDTKQKTG